MNECTVKLMKIKKKFKEVKGSISSIISSVFLNLLTKLSITNDCKSGKDC